MHWLGNRPYDSVPAYIKGLDVCMMCYVINDWTFFGDPSKMHEYLASGKPTVATGLSAIKEFSNVIDIPETFDGWVDAIERLARGPARPTPTAENSDGTREFLSVSGRKSDSGNPAGIGGTDEAT